MVYTILLVIHIAAGSIALLAVPFTLHTAKGRANHVLAGRVYTGGMTGVFVTALPLALITSSMFLFVRCPCSVSTWSLPGGVSPAHRRGRPHPVDWAAAGIMALTGLGMWGYSGVLASTGDSQWTTMVLYGAIAVSCGVVDLRFHFRPSRTGIPSDSSPPDQHARGDHRHSDGGGGGQRAYRTGVDSLDTAHRGNYPDDSVVEFPRRQEEAGPASPGMISPCRNSQMLV